MITKEIGSEFLLERIKFRNDKKNIDKCLFLENGRQCYKVLMDNVKGKIIFPAYACESMIQNIDRDRIVFYDVDSNLEIDFNSISDKDIDEASVFVYVDYFGFSQSKNNIKKIKILKNKNILIVEDITHSAFSNLEFIGDILICSMRKWFGIEGLGILYTENSNLLGIKLSEDNTFSRLRKRAFLEKENYASGKINTKIYLDMFNTAEEYANQSDKICMPTQDSMNRFYSYDYKQMIEKRRNNYLYLQNNLCSNHIYQIKQLDRETPLFFPIYAELRNELREFLIHRNIFCPIHWSKLESIDSNFNVHKILDNILSIPIDQRYDVNDMLRIIEAITDFYEKRKEEE